jgi:hypothetical protein
MGIVDDQTAEYLAEIRRAMAASREEAGLPSSTTAAPSLEEIAAAVRESGLVGALNNIAATTISTSVSLYHVLFFWVPYGNVLMVSCFIRSMPSILFFFAYRTVTVFVSGSYLRPLDYIFVRFS